MIADYVYWLREILQPSNRVMLDILTNKANAFDRRIPACFTDIMAHVSEYQVILKKWEKGDFTQCLLDFQAYKKKDDEVVLKMEAHRDNSETSA